MMCACEEEFARRFFPHQLKSGREPNTRHRIPVTGGFQKNICNTCRGIPEEVHPKAPLYGRTSKVVRYYWREIHFETTRRFAEWAGSKGFDDLLKAQVEYKEEYKRIEKTVIEDIKRQHEQHPKYVYLEESQSEILTRHQIEVVKLDGVYAKTEDGRAAIIEGGKLFSVEEYAAHHFEKTGHKVLFSESVPFHALFGVFMWPLIQDPEDSEVKTVGFGDRFDFEQGIEGKEVLALLAGDFGTCGYPLRRSKAIDKHLASLSDIENKDEFLGTFDYWIEPSENLRQYLWAHRKEDVAKARKIVSILPVDATIRILRYLVGDYWGRYLGWPDLLVHDKNDFFFAEVKSSKDKLSEEQKQWIDGNATVLHLPFKLVKIHKHVVKAQSRNK